MKLFYGSDLHLEFEKGSKHTLDIPEGNVLVLAGDVYCPWNKLQEMAPRKNPPMRHEDVYMSFFEEVSRRFDHVMYVLGNHEHYNGYFFETADLVKRHLEGFPNIHLLTNSYWQVEDVLFFGSTFWTDARGSHPEVMWDIKRGLNDYHTIYSSRDSYNPYKSGGTKLMVEDTVNENHYTRLALREFFTKAEEQALKPFVITHHQPSWECVEQYYRHDNCSYAYANTGFDEFLMDFPPHHWVAGHMHKNDVLQVGNAKVMTNSRGYVGYETSANKYAFQELDI